MEELFKSLSESVSEECFEDIFDMVEKLIGEASMSFDEFSKKMDEVKAKKEASGKTRKLTPSEKIANKTKREKLLTSVEPKKPKSTTMMGNPNKEETKEPEYLLGTPIKYPPLNK